MIVPPAARAPVVEAVKPWLQVAIEPALAGEAEKLATAEGVVPTTRVSVPDVTDSLLSTVVQGLAKYLVAVTV